MSWSTELIEILPDGTERYRATKIKEVNTNIGQNWTGYVMRVTCPVCGCRGGLQAHYHRNINKDLTYSVWYGPYLRVAHVKYSKDKYSKLREMGVDCHSAGSSSVLSDGYCYIGKNYPRRIPVDIPEPPEGG